MKRLLSWARYMALVATICLLLAAAAAFGFGAVKTVHIGIEIVTGKGVDLVELVHLTDSFLLAAGLLIFSLGMYELFIGKLELPGWLVIQDLHDLKVKLASIVVLIMAVTFLEHLVAWEDERGLLYRAAAIALVSGTLIAYTRFTHGD